MKDYASKLFVVEEKHTAAAMGSCDLAVLATPNLVAMVENTAKEHPKPCKSRTNHGRDRDTDESFSCYSVREKSIVQSKTGSARKTSAGFSI